MIIWNLYTAWKYAYRKQVLIFLWFDIEVWNENMLKLQTCYY